MRFLKKTKTQIQAILPQKQLTNQSKMAVAEKSLTVRITVIPRKNDRLPRKFCIFGLRSKIVNYINKKCRSVTYN